MSFINSKKEIAWGDFYFLNHVAPESFDYKKHKKEDSPFWESVGFRSSMMYSDFYSQLNGIESDRYIPMDLYYFYILPALNRFDFRMAYTDKCMYATLFRGVRMPTTVAKCMNGNCYLGDDSPCTFEQLVTAVCPQQGACIIKPSVDSCNGVGIALLQNQDEATLRAQLAKYGTNYIIQLKLSQHPEMGRLNKTSLNTLRVFTYRDVKRQVHYLPGCTFVRFGGEGAVMDNGSAGGGLIKVSDEGRLGDCIIYFKSMQTHSLCDKGIKDLVVPGFEHIRQFVSKLHQRLPHFDLIGWDIAVDESGEPTFIEFNIEPSVEGPQMVSGPFFGEFFEEIVNRIRGVRKEKSLCYRNIFKNSFEYQQIVNH